MHRREILPTILSALSNIIRLEILRILYSRGPLSFTGLMIELGMDPRMNTGKFGYHLKTLMKAGLVDLDKSSGCYRLTELGRSVLKLLKKIEDSVKMERDKLLVRTSLPSIEVFNRHRIVECLVKEANMPKRLAEEVAREVEARVRKMNIKYLTTALIRDIVNMILLERGLEEYRHALARLGMPVYDVSQIVEGHSSEGLSEDPREVTGRAVLEQYTLTRLVPRHVADAHISGLIHLVKAYEWALHPESIHHDVRVFLEERTPSSLSKALLTIFDVIATYSRLVALSQVVEHFNTFIAPYIGKLTYEELKNRIREFIELLNAGTYFHNAVISLDVGIPKPIGEEKCPEGTYGDYEEEALRVVDAFVEVFMEGDDEKKPYLRPLLTVKIYKDSLKGHARNTLLKLAKLASARGTPLFINLTGGGYSNMSYSDHGLRVYSTIREEWDEILMTGSIGTVALNMPRIAFESRRDEEVLLDKLDAAISLCLKALEARYKTLERRLKVGKLPEYSFEVRGNAYLRMHSSTLNISLIGLPEAVKLITGYYPHENRDARGLIAKLLREANKFVCEEAGFERRVNIAEVRVEDENFRFAEMDSRYGDMPRESLRGDPRTPYYTTDLGSLAIPFRDLVRITSEAQKLTPGGHVLNINMAEPSPSAEKLLSTIERLLREKVNFFTFTRDLTYCRICRRIEGGLRAKCSYCSFSGSKIIHYGRLTTRYETISSWDYGKRIEYMERFRHII
ncbi:MAG: hypothetical protein DRM97_01760 [Thermoprotei archaeon]|nr:MAG: hypothetical protein DRM97_01760 [Thermoprotei archaeon]